MKANPKRLKKRAKAARGTTVQGQSFAQAGEENLQQKVKEAKNGQQRDTTKKHSTKWIFVVFLSVFVVAILVTLGSVSSTQSSSTPPSFASPQFSSNKFSAILLGASGATGKSLLRQLLQNPRCANVVVIGRKPIEMRAIPAHLKLKLHEIVLEDLGKIAEIQAKQTFNADRLFCALGSRVKYGEQAFRRVEVDYVISAAKWAKNLPNFQHFSLVSSLGASNTSFLLYSRVKGEVEKALREVELPRTSVFRPSLLLCKRSEKRIFEEILQYIAPHIDFLLVGPLRKYRSITVESVAKAMIANAEVNNVHMDSKQPIFELYESDVIQAMADEAKESKM